MTKEEQAIEYIKRYRKLDEKLYDTAPKGTVSSNATKKCLEFWDMAIKALEQEPKTGHWINTGNYYTGAYETIDYVKCSCCGAESLEEGDYCPNCGAEMEV